MGKIGCHHKDGTGRMKQKATLDISDGGSRQEVCGGPSNMGVLKITLQQSIWKSG
jgi:hypothetical protein